MVPKSERVHYISRVCFEFDECEEGSDVLPKRHTLIFVV